MSRKRLIVCSALLICGGIACWFFPLFHIRTLSEVKAGNGEQSAMPRPSIPADPVGYARNFWDGPLRTHSGGTEIERLWNDFDANKSKARSQYGRQSGVGGAWYFVIHGQGTVDTVEKGCVVLTLANSSRRARLELGVVVDNTVREAICVKASEFANSQDFNEVSSELNRRVERDVIASNKSLLKPGAIVDFVGCTKISRDSDLDPLRLIPIRLEVHHHEDRNTDTIEETNSGASQ